MDPRRRTLASVDPHGGSNIPLPSSALKRPQAHLASSVREGGGGNRFSLAPQRLPSHSGARQSSVATGSNFQFSQHSDAYFQSSQATGFSNSQHQDAARRSSVYQAPQTVNRQPTSSSNFPAASRGSMSVNRNEHAHYRSSSANDVPPAGLLNSHSTPSANRASSVGPFQVSHHGTSSLLPPFQTYKDPRTRDRKTIASWQHEVYEFLQERGYPEPLTIKTLQTPTTKDFQNIFKFMIQCSDHGHVWGIYGKKPEDEVIPLLKSMGYIAYDALTKSGLQAPGSMHTWPTLLAMLQWIVTTIKLREEAMSNDKMRLDTQVEPSPDDSRAEDLAATSHWLQYLEATYKLFLQSDDFDRELHKPPLEEYFQKRKDRVLSEIERLEGRNSQLEQEFNRLASKPSALEGAKKEHKKLAKDAQSFLEYLAKLREANKKSEKYNQSIKQDLESAEVKLRESQKKKVELAALVAKQNISDAELQHISSTRAQLERSSAAAQAKHSQLKEAMLDLEVRSTQASDRVEKTLTIYKNKAVKLGLIPRAPEPFEHLDFSQTVNSGAADVVDMLPDTLIDIKPALIQLKKNAIDHRLGLTDQVLLVEEKLANLTETLQEKRENLQILETSVQQLAKQLEDDKEKFAAEIGRMNEQIDTILKRVTETESTIENSRVTVDHEIQALRVRFDETQERLSKLTKDNVDEMNSILGFIVSYKERIAEKTLQLKHLSESTGGPSINLDVNYPAGSSGTNNTNMRI
ncbi:kinetochore-associated Ndc80 complex subunit ndc80 [Puccinia graminis f. sp. tritici]|uniref:Kinetochore protein NDC80 n=1 Tax=Puccinia graminis f. sp. tritici TaxID=56615 RepID=A0A5B0PIW5_PUCGR|nr:kinetochore-associated Ndc80 complex subunit ndc80 [Puccinia graminis f. sp. tritici]